MEYFRGNATSVSYVTISFEACHDDVIKWKHFPRYQHFVLGIHRSLVNSPHKGQWRRALMFSLICTWINGWVNNREAGDLRRHRGHYDVTVMKIQVKRVSLWEDYPVNKKGINGLLTRLLLERSFDGVFSRKCHLRLVCHYFVWSLPWWRHQMEAFSALPALCAGNSPVTGEFSAQRPVTQSFDVFFDLHLNKRLSKQSWGWWSETPSRSLWRHSNENTGETCISLRRLPGQ